MITVSPSITLSNRIDSLHLLLVNSELTLLVHDSIMDVTRQINIGQLVVNEEEVNNGQ